uniref:aspartate transaminase n=1 Tax=Timema monikensis TaxID=170555 RepID=A0A7R9HN49_9NEOP|nr:unnamed protein product [Timema monikensis]
MLLIHKILFPSTFPSMASCRVFIIYEKVCMTVSYYCLFLILMFLYSKCCTTLVLFNVLGERVGCLITVVNNKRCLLPYLNHMENIIRSAYCNPPKHGCQIVSRILQSSELFQKIENVSTMAKRVKRVRYELQERLESLGTPGNWNHITKQIGMFSYTGMTSWVSFLFKIFVPNGLLAKQVEHMVKKYHIYMLESGRINISGIGSKNIDYVARAIHESVVLSPQDTNETKNKLNGVNPLDEPIDPQESRSRRSCKFLCMRQAVKTAIMFIVVVNGVPEKCRCQSHFLDIQ